MTTFKFAKAFAPGNISCFFKPHQHKNPRWRGSTGLGFTVNEGVLATVTKATKTEIFFNNEEIQLPTVAFVIKKLTNNFVRVEIVSSLPLGSGFGLSGASALATAYAINTLFQLGKTKKQLAVIAHTADADNKTGLGDVANQYLGGFLLKTKPSSKFIVQKIPLTSIHVYWSSFSSLSTKKVLTDEVLLEKISKAADTALRETTNLLLSKNVSFAKLLNISFQFVETSGLLKDAKTKHALENVKKSGGHASMIVVGNAVMSDAPFPGAKKLMISNVAAHVIGE